MGPVVHHVLGCFDMPWRAASTFSFIFGKNINVCMLVVFALIALLLLVNQFRPGLYSDSWAARSSRVSTHPVNSSVKTPGDTYVGFVINTIGRTN